MNSMVSAAWIRPIRVAWGTAGVFTDAVDQTVSDVLRAIETEDWTAFAKLVHPYVQWTEDGHTTRGRTRVMAMLSARAHETGHAPAHPAREIALRDGQVYRWTV